MGASCSIFSLAVSPGLLIYVGWLCMYRISLYHLMFQLVFDQIWAFLFFLVSIYRFLYKLWFYVTWQKSFDFYRCLSNFCNIQDFLQFFSSLSLTLTFFLCSIFVTAQKHCQDGKIKSEIARFILCPIKFIFLRCLEILQRCYFVSSFDSKHELN